MDLTLIVVLVIALAVFFDFTNGFHDTANAMATPIATGAMRPRVAVTVAACLNLVGAFLSTEVAKTISGGIIREGPGGVDITPTMIFAGLVGAVIWNMITWLRGLPSSSSHALFGGLIGAAVVGAGFDSVDFGVVLSKVVLPAVLAPLVAGLVAFTCTRLAYFITRRPNGKNQRGGFRVGQIFTSSMVALAHGTNDAQKTMGVITLTLIAGGFLGVERVAADLGDRRLRLRHRHAAPTPAAGESSRRSAAASPTSRRRRASRPRRRPPRRCWPPVTSASRSRRRRCRRARSSAQGSAVAGRRSSGARPARSSSPGSSPCLPRARSAPSASSSHGSALFGLIIDALLGAAVIVGIFVASRRKPAEQSNALEVDVAMNSVFTRKERRALLKKRSDDMLEARRRLSDESSLFELGAEQEETTR